MGESRGTANGFFSRIYICPEKPRILFIILVPVEWRTPQREVYFTQVGIIRNVALKEVLEIRSISSFEFTDHSKEVSMSNTVTQIALRLCDHWLWALRVWRFPRPGDKETAKERTQWILPPLSLVNTPASWREMDYRKSLKLARVCWLILPECFMAESKPSSLLKVVYPF